MKKYLLVLSAISFLTACGNDGQNMGHSMPIDSSNVNGTAPARYGGDRPGDDTNQTNVGDTATKANNVHNTGTYIKH